MIQTADLHGAVAKNRIFRTAELVRRVTEQNGGVECSIRIDCGDLIQGSHAMTFEPFRQAMFHILNDLHFEAFVPGNHDLEFGIRALQKALTPFRGTLLAANWQWQSFPAKKDYVILHKNGLKAAVIGLGYHHASPDLSRPSEKGLLRTAPARNTLRRIMPEVMREKPHIIILAVHAGEHTRLEQGITLRDLAGEFPQIDLVLSSHSHQECRGKVLKNNTVRMQAPALGKGIAVAHLRYDTVKRAVTSLKTEILPVNGDTPMHRKLFREMHSLNRIVKQEGRKIIGTVPFELGPLQHGKFSNPLTELCFKAITESTGADIVFYTPSTRFRKMPGPLNSHELFLLFPYEESAGVLELDHNECMEILSEQIRNRRKGYFQAPGGIKFKLKRSRVTALTLQDGNVKNKYRCAFSNYILAGGGGRFPVLKAIAQKHRIRFYTPSIRDMLRHYIIKNLQKKGSATP